MPEVGKPARDFIESLSMPARVKIYRNIKILEQQGVLLKEPYTRQIFGKIRELRIYDGHGAYRILFFSFTGRRIILLHGFSKKTDKTPQGDIETARRRMADFVARGGGI
jgi:phage-related protein